MRINEVLGNLLSNAFKFTNKAGRVSLVVGREGDHVRMEVSDTGAGIPQDQLPHIFEKFYQADTQAPLALRGAGLGLAIAKSIVTAHSGTHRSGEPRGSRHHLHHSPPDPRHPASVRPAFRPRARSRAP